MDKHAWLNKLESRTPLFDNIPTVGWKRIMGTESEYGVQNTLVDGKQVIDSDKLPMMLRNGGEVYEDCGHVEYASPETSNPAAAVAYYEAGKVWCWNEQYSPALFCHNNDWNGNTFGAHENYFTYAARSEWHRLIPFLIARTAFCGAGWLNNGNCFEISQRAHAIQCAKDSNTTTNRPIINMRDEPLAKMPGHHRLHIICGDATMSEVATFLRLGATSCMVEMLEMGALPRIEYSEICASDDMKSVSRMDWILRGVSSGPRNALEILSLYYTRATELFSHRDAVTDAVLAVWEDTVNKLAIEPLLLWRRLDWVAKLFLLRFFKEHENSEPTSDMLRSQDMAYHNLNPAEGLYYHLAQAGEMERVVSDVCIIHAAHEPPRDTRAYARGKVVQLLEDRGGHKVLCANSWDKLSMVDGAARGFPRVMREPKPRAYLSLPMPNPRKTYAHLIERVQKEFFRV